MKRYSTYLNKFLSLPVSIMVFGLLIAGAYFMTPVSQQIPLVQTVQAACTTYTVACAGDLSICDGGTTCSGSDVIGDCTQCGTPGNGGPVCPHGNDGLSPACCALPSLWDYNIGACIYTPPATCWDGSTAPNNDPNQCPIRYTCAPSGDYAPNNDPSLCVQTACQPVEQYYSCGAPSYATAAPNGPYSWEVTQYYQTVLTPGPNGGWWCAFDHTDFTPGDQHDAYCSVGGHSSFGDPTYDSSCCPIDSGGPSGSCPLPAHQTLSCPTGGGTYTRTTTYSGASCSPSVTNDQATQCSSSDLQYDFWADIIGLSPTHVLPGEYTWLTVFEQYLSGTTESVHVAAPGWPAGIEDWDYDANRDGAPSNVTNITVYVEPTVAPGTYYLSVTGSPGNKVSLPVPLIVDAPASANNTIYVTYSGLAPTDNAAWMITGGGAPLLRNLNPATPLNQGPFVVTSPANTTYKMTLVPFVTGYNYPPVVTYTIDGGAPQSGPNALLSGGQTLRYNLAYTSNAVPFDYQLSSTIAPATDPGFPTASTITKQLVSGTSQNVHLDITSSWPPAAGVTGSISGGGDCTPNCTNTLTISTSASTPAGNYPITITGTPGNIPTHVNLIVNPPPFGFSGADCTVTSPTTLPAYVGQPVTWSVNGVSGGVGVLHYSWAGDNIPVAPNDPKTSSFSVTYTTTGIKKAVATVTDSAMPVPHTYTCPVSTGPLSNGGNGGTGARVRVTFDPKFQEF